MKWEGEIGNARVRQLFEIQTVQASRLLAEFRQKWAGVLIEDTRAKVLRAREGFASEATLEDYARYALAPPGEDECLVDARVNLDRISPSVFASVRKAAIEGIGVEIAYASMSADTPTRRTIFPHSLVLVGRRWHVRAWCGHHRDFRDFVVGRIRAIATSQEKRPVGKKDDAGWNTEVVIRLAAHSALTPEQQQVIRSEYFGNTQARRVSVRACLAKYVIQDLRAAIDPAREAPPEYQLEVTNIAELQPLLFRENGFQS